MTTCLYLGSHVGTTVACCNAKAAAVHRCDHSRDKVALEYCVPSAWPKAESAVETLDGRTVVWRLTQCALCPERTLPVQLETKLPDPVKQEARNGSRTYQLWKQNPARRDKLPVGVKTSVVLDCDRRGFGDAIVGAWLAEGTKDRDPKIMLHATGAKRELLELFSQNVVAEKPDIAVSSHGAGLEAAIGGYPPRVFSWAAQFGIDAAFARPRHNISLNAQALASRVIDENRRKYSAAQYERLVALCPQTDGPSRQWPPVYWCTLAEQLRANGIWTYWLGTGDHHYHNEPGYMMGGTWEQTATRLLLADLVIAVDSAAIHVAGTLNRPSIALLGPTGDSAFSHIPSIRCVAAERRIVDCVHCWYAHPYDSRLCNLNCAAMSNLRSDAVFDLAMRVLKQIPKIDDGTIS